MFYKRYVKMSEKAKVYILKKVDVLILKKRKMMEVIILKKS